VLQSRQILEQLNAHTYQLLKTMGLPFFIISSDEQTGANFGENLSMPFNPLVSGTFNSRHERSRKPAISILALQAFV